MATTAGRNKEGNIYSSSWSQAILAFQLMEAEAVTSAIPSVVSQEERGVVGPGAYPYDSMQLFYTFLR